MQRANIRETEGGKNRVREKLNKRWEGEG